MNWVDLIIIIVVILFALDGTRRGFINQAFNVFGFLFSLLCAATLFPYSAYIFIKFFNLSQIYANPIGFFLNWFIAEAIFFGVFTKLFTKLAVKLHQLKINKYLGTFPAILSALLVLAFAFLFLVSLPISAGIKKNILDSKLGSPLIDQATILEKPFSKIFGPLTKQSLTFLTVKPEEKGSINLGFIQTNQTVDYKSEQKMFELVNLERKKSGAKPLIWNEKLAQVGRNYSGDMFSKGYFSHFSREGKDIGDRLQENEIPYYFVGENLALAPDVARANSGLMASEGHRRNILDPAFSKIGIGAVDGGIYGKIFTQIFTN